MALTTEQRNSCLALIHALLTIIQQGDYLRSYKLYMYQTVWTLLSKPSGPWYQGEWPSFYHLSWSMHSQCDFRGMDTKVSPV